MPLLNGMRGVNTWACLYFILLVVVGNYIILNLFLAILLDNFGGADDDDEEEEEEEEEEVPVEAKKTDANLPSTTYNSFIKDTDGKLGKSVSLAGEALGPPGGGSPSNSKALGMASHSSTSQLHLSRSRH